MLDGPHGGHPYSAFVGFRNLGRDVESTRLCVYLSKSSPPSLLIVHRCADQTAPYTDGQAIC